jgi:hypothetical protein
MKKKIVALFDFNDDGEVNILDLHSVAVSHVWMLLAGGVIAVGSLGNVLDFWRIDSDFFWFCAGIAGMAEYIDDVRRRKRE